MTTMRHLLICFLAALMCTAHGQTKKEPPKPTAEIQTMIEAAQRLPKDQVLSALDKVIYRAHKAGDKAGEAEADDAWGERAHGFGRLRDALERFQLELPIRREMGDRRGEANTLHNIGTVYSDLGQKQKALEYFAQALPIEREVGDRSGEAITLTGIGVVYSDLGQEQKALEYYAQALRIEREVGNRRWEAYTLTDIGVGYSDLGQKQKALEYYAQALSILREVGDRRGEAYTYTYIGSVYDHLGQKQKALEYYAKALPIGREVGDREGEASTLSNIGTVYGELGQKQEALEYYAQALPILREVGGRVLEATTLSNIGWVYDDLGQKQKALEYYAQALPIRREVGDRFGEATTLNNIGLVYNALGQKQKALQYFGQALPILREVGARGGEATTLSNIGAVYGDLGQKQKALEYYAQALPIEREVADRGGEATTLNNIGLVYDDLGQKQKALEYYAQSLPIRREVGDRDGEATTLNNIGKVYSDLGQKQKALEYYAQALPIEREVGDRDGEATTLRSLGVVREGTEPWTAVLLLKQSVNIYQSLRRDISGLPTKEQATYRDSVAGAYRHLADLLIRQARIIEAEKVLDLLKDSERFEFLRRDPALSADQKVEYVGREQGWYARWQSLEDHAVEVGVRGTELRRAKAAALGRGEKFADDAKLKAAEDDETVVQKAMTEYFKVLDEEAAEQNKALAKVRQEEMAEFKAKVAEPLGRLQRSTGSKVAAVYGLTLGDNVHFIVATPQQEPVAISVTVDESSLNKAIGDLRAALRDPWSDPKAPGKKLYDLVLAKVVHELRQAGIHHVMWALDGALRTIPLAAVWDGEHYLVETESYTVYSPLELEKLDAEKAAISEVAAFGSTQGGTIGSETFPPLRNVRGEVLSVVYDPSKKAYGAVDGVPWIDKDFTKELFLSQMGYDRYNIAHVASHFDLKGDYVQSALLTGDAKLVSLKEMLGAETLTEAMTKKPWSHLDLVVLSACDTASSGSGAEGESFASVVLGLGAASVMASLWSVSDDSTALLMGEFYRNWKSGMTKEEALRRAQISMIRSVDSSKASKVRSVSVSAGHTTAAGYSHPYYWAPFVIYGNWR
jgi:CHAT domain-containing protein/tetratricopeptide (TPR) repeat protein